MKILAIVEKYLAAIIAVLYIIFILIFGLDNYIIKLLEEIIEVKNEIIMNIASIFIGMYITLALMYPTFINGGSLDKLSTKNYLTSFRYIVIGLLFSIMYILNFLFDGILYNLTALNCFLLILMFISFVRVVLFVLVWLIYDILTKKVIRNNDINYDKKIYEKLKNIEDQLKNKKK